MGKVRNILHSKGSTVFSMEPTVTVYKAIELMSEKSISSLLVIDANGKLQGIFTNSDYSRKLILKGKSSKDTLLKDLMTENPVGVTSESTIEDCMKIMTSKKIRHLPVIDGDKVCGMISMGDVVKFIIEEQKGIIADLEQYITNHHS